MRCRSVRWRWRKRKRDVDILAGFIGAGLSANVDLRRPGSRAMNLGRKQGLPVKPPTEPAHFGLGEIFRRRLIPRPRNLDVAAKLDLRWLIDAERRLTGQFLGRPAL